MNAQIKPGEMKEVGLLPVTTLVCWLACAAVGITGLYLRYPRPYAPARPPPPVVAQVMHVELTNDQSLPPPDIGPPSTPADEPAPQPPPMPDAAVAPPSPALVQVAEPSPNIAFALPAEGPTQAVDAKQAIPTRAAPATTTTVASPQHAAAAPGTVQRLRYGHGEGQQPAPEYPREAALAHQQGTVLVRLTVGEDGRVETASAARPCPYAMLNQAAVRAVRETWRFQPGAPRTYEVAIEFELRHRSSE